MIHFIRRLKELNPSIIVSQPTYGYPQVRTFLRVVVVVFVSLISIALFLKVHHDFSSLDFLSTFSITFYT